MINQKQWAVSSVVGSILQVLGVIPFLIWMASYAGWVETERGHWPVIIVAAALFGFGTLLVQGKGDSISDVILGMLPKKE
jgi:hypothetical protein